ncbi:unnamed protein product, partial [Oppiella nova]
MDTSVTCDPTQTDAMEQFCSITGADESMARTALESCNWNLELAVNMFVDQNDGQMDTNTTNHTNASTANHTNRFDANS